MKHILRLPAALLTIALIISLAGCSGGDSKSSSSQTSSTASSLTKNNTASQTPSDSSVTTSGGFSLPYNSVACFNPLLPATDSDMALWPLMYDCLAEPDTSYNPVNRLASSITCSGTTVTVQLKDGVEFTDGSSLSADDVVYSYESVMKDNRSPYHSRLSNVSKIEGSGSTVTITLKSADTLFANLLDIPIIENNTGTTSNAVGTGRYTYKTNGINAVLTLNPNWYGGKMSSIKTIPLVNIPKADAIMTSLSIDEINYVYSDSGSGQTTATTNTVTAPVNLNRLVFIGINSQRAHLNNSHFRRALLLSIDRGTLVSQYYSSHAEGCILPFNPSWSKLPKPTSKELSADFTTATSEMKLAGGTGGNTALTLLVNSDNSVRTAAARYIASCFSKAGISVKVHAVSYPTYNMLIQKKTFDMYIGEIKISNDMNISPLLTTGSYGTLSNSATLTAYNGWRSGNVSIKSIAKTFKNETPFIPLCYRTGTASFTKGVSGVKATDGDIFFDFQNWSQK